MIDALAEMLAMSGMLEDSDGGGPAAWEQLALDNQAGACCLLRLLHLQLAWSLQAEHGKLKGRSPIAAQLPSSSSSSSSSRQQILLPCYHQQYLRAVGAPTDKLAAVCPRPLALATLAAAMHTHAARAQQQQKKKKKKKKKKQSTLSVAAWHELEVSALVPTPEQLLMVLEAAVLDPPNGIGFALHMFSVTCCSLAEHGCLEEAAGVLLPPALHLLPLVVQHVAPAPSE
eukprot:jgi/Sobl393_1/11647/SZX73502.1